MRVRYIGPYERVEFDLPDGSTRELARGEVITVADDYARRLLEQPTNWELVSHMGGPSLAERQIAPRPEERFALAVRQLRNRKGLSQDNLSKVLADKGHPMRKSALGEIERSEQRLKLDDALAIAAALDTTPFHLLTMRAGQGIAVTPTTVVKGRRLRAWLRGQQPLPAGRRYSTYERAVHAYHEEGKRYFRETADDQDWLRRQRDELTRAHLELHSIIDILMPHLDSLPEETRSQLADAIDRLNESSKRLQTAETFYPSERQPARVERRGGHRHRSAKPTQSIG